MDRSVIYPGQVPLETDLLFAQRASMVGLSKLAAAMLGTGTVVNGLAVTQTTVASMSVQVAAGEIYQLVNLDATAYSSLAADTTHNILKQGVNLDTTQLALTAPGTGGFSINYLIQATLTEADGTPVVLPYFNASNPATAYSGPAGAGTAQGTRRTAVVTLSAKAGTAAATGSQTTPAPDAGNVGIAVVTVANGAVTVVNANISAYGTAPVITPLLNGRLLNIQRFTASGTYTPTPGTTSIIFEVLGGGGGGGGAAVTGAGQISGGAGGNSGAYGKSRSTSGFAGAAVTIGAGGTAGAIGGAGGAGGASSFMGVSAPGGLGGTCTGAQTPPYVAVPVGNTATVATGASILNACSQSGSVGVLSALGSAFSGGGGSTPLANGPGGTASGAGTAATGFGCGGAGAVVGQSTAGNTGGAGAPGVVVIYEYA